MNALPRQGVLLLEGIRDPQALDWLAVGEVPTKQ